VAKILERRFVARRAEFAAIRAHLESACVALPSYFVQRFVLIAEELFCNSIEHGYGGDCDQPVWLTVTPAADGCTLIYRDAAPAHDPFVHVTLPRAQSVEALPVGGLGVYLIGQFCTLKRYQWHAEHNVIELFVPLESAQTAANAS